MKWYQKLATLITDVNGTLSHRKVIAFIFVVYVGWMLTASYLTNNGQLYSDLTYASVIGGALGISYIRQIANLKNPSQ